MRRAALGLLLSLAAFFAMPAAAHEVRPAYLELTETAPGVFDVAWKQPVRDGKRLKLTPVFPDDCQSGPAQSQALPGAILARWTLTCPLDRGELRIDGLARTLTDVFVRIEYTDSRTHTALLRPAASSLNLGTNEQTASPATSYFRLGIVHIAGGYDHLLFVFALCLLVRMRQLFLTLTAFTLAHSITLGAASLGLASLPGPPIEILIALSIVFLAAEAIWRMQGKETLAARYPFILAGGFGLIHGFGFAGALGAIGLPKSAELLALVLFNLGVEAGQIIAVAAMLALGFIILKLRGRILPAARRLAAYAIGSMGAFWLISRLASLAETAL